MLLTIASGDAICNNSLLLISRTYNHNIYMYCYIEFKDTFSVSLSVSAKNVACSTMAAFVSEL